MSSFSPFATFADGDNMSAAQFMSEFTGLVPIGGFITDRTQLSSAADDDLILVYDTSTSTLCYVTRSAFVATASTNSIKQTVSQTSHGFSVGQVVYPSSTAGVYALASATSAALSDGTVGVIDTVSDANTFTAVTHGLVPGLSSLTAGTVYYLSDVTAGSVTSVASTTAIKVYTAISTTAAIVNINKIGASSGGSTTSFVCNGRLTGTTSTPVTTADVSPTTIYFTPYQGNKIALYSGSSWTTYTFTEISIGLSSLTAGKNYDVFVYNNSGTLTLELSAAWASDTARTDALTTQDGVLVKLGATTRRYLGSFRANGANATADTVLLRWLWNYYNRVPRPMRVLETTDSWTYTTAAYRQANGSGANQLDFIIGVNEEPVTATVTGSGENSGGNVQVQVGIGLDSTTALATGVITGVGNTQAAATQRTMIANYHGFPGLGHHVLTWLEFSTASGTTTWAGDNGGATVTQNGMSGIIRG